jgi:Short C-terminal domain
MRQLSSAGQQAIADIAQRHGFSTDAVMHMLDAVVRGNCSMAQFSHPEFAGSGQWMRGGMTMVSDMFNNYLKGRVDGLCSELANLVANQPGLVQTGSFQSQNQGSPMPAVSWGAADGPAGGNNLFAPAPPDWWGPSLRWPNSTGAQNGARYAYFAQARRLAVELGGTVTIYDTLDHQIGGFSQQQSGDGSMTCSSQYGTVWLSSLPVVSINGMPPPPQASAPTWNGSQGAMDMAPAATGFSNPAPNVDVLATLQKLAELHSAGILTADEFGAKKAELLSRL